MVVEVAKTEGLTRQGLDLGVKTLGGPVVHGESPTAGDPGSPAVQSLAAMWRFTRNTGITEGFRLYANNGGEPDPKTI
jgi:hypothetical protein